MFIIVFLFLFLFFISYYYMEINNATHEFYSLMLKYMKKYTWSFYHIKDSSNILCVSCIASDVDNARRFITIFIKDLEKKIFHFNKDIMMIDNELNDIVNDIVNKKNVNISDETLMIGLQLSKDILIKKRSDIINNITRNITCNNNVTCKLYEYSLNMNVKPSNNLNSEMTLESLINLTMPETTNFNNISFN